MYPPPTPRLQFREWREDDLPLARTLYGDPRVTKLLGARPYDEQMIQDRLAKELETARTLGVQYWPVFTTAGEFVGCCGLRGRSPEERVYELGFYLCFDHWGKGLAREAATAVIAHAFGPVGASGLYAGHHPDNESSRRVLESLGFRYTHHELYPPTGLDEPCYELTREQFATRTR